MLSISSQWLMFLSVTQLPLKELFYFNVVPDPLGVFFHGPQKAKWQALTAPVTIHLHCVYLYNESKWWLTLCPTSPLCSMEGELMKICPTALWASVGKSRKNIIRIQVLILFSNISSKLCVQQQNRDKWIEDCSAESSWTSVRAEMKLTHLAPIQRPTIICKMWNCAEARTFSLMASDEGRRAERNDRTYIITQHPSLKRHPNNYSWF